jgi:hypothetical protein
LFITQTDHVCTILDTTGPTHFHPGKSKAHLINHFTVEAFNVPLVTFNIFNELTTTKSLFGNSAKAKKQLQSPFLTRIVHNVSIWIASKCTATSIKKIVSA